MDKVLTDLKHLLEEELRMIVEKNDISPTELENATKAVCLMEKILELEEWPTDEEMEEYYSRRAHPMRRSYRRGRDADTGRYISRRHDRMMDEEGYSNHSIKDRMIAKLEGMYDDADSEHEKETIDKFIAKLEMEK